MELHVKLIGDYGDLDEGLVHLQTHGIQVESLEGIEGWLLQSFGLSGVEPNQWEDCQQELLTHCLSDPQTLKLMEQWFSCLNNKIQTFGLPEGLASAEENQISDGKDSTSEMASEEVGDYLDELYGKMLKLNK